MIKPGLLRKVIEEAVPSLKNNADRLIMFIEGGQVASRLGSLSFEYNYTLVIGLTDYADHPDRVMIPVLQWLRVNQPSLLQNPETAKKAITYEAEILNHTSYDLRLDINLSERVLVTKNNNNNFAAKHLREPALAETIQLDNLKVLAGDELIYDSQQHI